MAKQREFKAMAREYYRLLAQADWKPPRKKRGLVDWIVNILFIALVAMAIGIGAQIVGWLPPPRAQSDAQPTATATRPFPTNATLGGSGSTARDPIAVATPIPGLAQNEATATAQYNEAVQRSQNGAVVLPANDPQPVQLIQQPAERQPAGVFVPIAEPVDTSATPVNIQETHACKHGQTWIDGQGCKNPGYDYNAGNDKGSKSRP